MENNSEIFQNFKKYNTIAIIKYYYFYHYYILIQSLLLNIITFIIITY